MSQLFTPVRIGRYMLPNRLVMAPMTDAQAVGWKRVTEVP